MHFSKSETSPGISFTHSTLPQNVFFGTGKAVDNTLTALTHLRAERVMLVHSLSSTVMADSLASKFNIVARINRVVQHVPLESVTAAREIVQQSKADVIISVGGGSATGLAKAIALTSEIPIIAIPTTFSGSEATDVWGITDNAEKTTGKSIHALPHSVIYDANLTLNLTHRQAIASGLNAVAHAVDGFWAPQVDPINSSMAVGALEILVPALRSLHQRHSDVGALERMQIGCYLAAVAFASSGSGMHHKICHVLGGAFNLPHAQMHAILLPYVVEFNAPYAPEAAQRVARIFNRPHAPASLDLFRRELDVKMGLKDIGFAREDIQKAAELILSAIPSSNPRPATESDLTRLLEMAWANTPIMEGNDNEPAE